MTSVVFVSNKESNAQKHLNLLKNQVDHVYEVTGVNGVRNAYIAACEISPTDYFFIVDGDNEVFPTFNQEWIHERANEPAIYWSTNEFGIQYGHGAIKLLHKEQFKDLPTRPFIDLTERLFKNRYRVCDIVLSRHHLSSGFQRWSTLFRELTKLTLRQNKTLREWLKHEEPRLLHYDVCEFIRKSTPRKICEILNDRDKLYEIYQMKDAQKSLI